MTMGVSQFLSIMEHTMSLCGCIVNKPQAAGMVSGIDRPLHFTIMYVHKVMHKSRVNLPIIIKLESAI